MISKLRSAYAWLLLSLVMLMLLPVAPLVRRWMAPRDPRRDRFRIFAARWISLYARLTPLYRFRLEGREQLPPTGAYVLVANHESGLDVLCLLMLGTPARFLAEDWMFRIPLARGLFRSARHIPVEVGERGSGRKALATAQDALKEGSPVAIFPEGKLSPDGMAEFRPGAFVLASRAGVPIIPVRLVGTGRAWLPGTLVVEGAHEIRIVVLPPVSASEVASSDPAALAQRVRRMLEAAGN